MAKTRMGIIQSMTLPQMTEDMMEAFQILFEDGVPTKDYFRRWLTSEPEEGEPLYFYSA